MHATTPVLAPAPLAVPIQQGARAPRPLLQPPKSHSISLNTYELFQRPLFSLRSLPPGDVFLARNPAEPASCTVPRARNKQERPYHDDSTASRLLSEVKHHRAWLVLRWGTTLESQVLFFFHRPTLVLPQPAAGSAPPRLILCAPRGNPSYARGGSHPPRLPPHRPSSSPQNAPPFNTKPMNFFDHPVFFLRLLPPGRVFPPHNQAKRPSYHTRVAKKNTRNDHTMMTAPLPVCSAKLSIIGPG